MTLWRNGSIQLPQCLDYASLRRRAYRLTVRSPSVFYILTMVRSLRALTLFARLFRKSGSLSRLPPQAPAGLRIYAIGDIHGRADLLDTIADRIARDNREWSGECLTIFLGDFIDRGADSAGVLERLSTNTFPTPIKALRGNHEEMLLRFLGDASALESWRRYGGLETLHSYGIHVADVMRGRNYEEARVSLLQKMPARHIAFLRETSASIAAQDYFFCHAGVRPGVALDQQDPQDLLWIREEFLNYSGDFGKRIVHGHTPVEQPSVHENRINIDTGAYTTGILTCLVLEGETVRFFSTK